MTFSAFCTGVVVTMLLGLFIFINGIIMAGFNTNDRTPWIISWILSTLGFGICFTLLLYQNGVL